MTTRETDSGGNTGPSMSATRWRQIQSVLARALDLPSSERAALLARECAGDDDLRAELEGLLAAHDSPGALDRLADAAAVPSLAPARESLLVEPGRTISRYVVLERLGAGGMGVVYRARDARLDRQIALKFLPPHLGLSEGAKRRFLLEARAAAALEHPNVCTIHEIGETEDGQLYIAMPLYEGETLQARLRRGPLSAREALPLAREIAAGLAAAHESGVVHRDIKPSNIMLLPDGRLKILDFGVAKLESVTMTASGTAIGTLAYMSPEQARGDRIDSRTDVWSLGVVLYEMLAGCPPFTAESSAALIYAILSREPVSIGELCSDVPPPFADLISAALAKSPDDRVSSMMDFIAALDRVEAAVSGTGVRTPVRRATRPSGAPVLESAAPSAERRRAAIVSSTISEYSSLMERLDHEEVDVLIARIREAAVDATRRHGGIVNQAIGEEIVALFGIPASHEDDELRAVRAALELRDAAARIETDATVRAGISIRVQSGIHAGPVVAQRMREGPRRYGVSGAPVQLAARLCALAPPGAVLLSQDCGRAVAPFVNLEPDRPLELQPGSPPVGTFQALGETGLQTRLEAAERAGLTPYTGRSQELATLERLVEGARRGTGRVVLVTGEAGIGKSRLVYEVIDRTRDGRIRVLQGRCRSYGGVEPFLPFTEILRGLVLDGGPGANDLDASAVAGRVLAIDRSLEPFVPLYLHLLSIGSDLYPVPRHLLGQHLQSALLDSLSALVTLAARELPLLLVLEDWHWADEASREALRRLTEVVEAHPIAVVVTSRPDPSIVSDLSDGTIVRLEPLDWQSTAEIMRALLAADRVSPELTGRVHERTGGNPLFLEQIAHTLQEEAAVATRDGEAGFVRATDSLRLPDSVQAVIRARLDRLDGDAREVLRVASVVGREFSRSLLVAGLGEGIDPSAALERLRGAGLIQQMSVVPEPAYRFRHVLTREVAYDSLLEHQSKTLHGLVGTALERHCPPDRLPETAELLAHHFSRAEDWPQAVRFGSLAADRLKGLSQYAEALAILERVQEWLARLPEDAGRRDRLADLLLKQERLCETLGHRRRQQEIISDLITLLAPHGGSARLAEAYLRQGDLLTLLKRYDAADRALGTVLRMARERGDAAMERHALRSVGLLRWHQGRHEEALMMAEGALAIDRERHDELSVAGDLANVGIILKNMGELDRAQAALEDALRLPAVADDPMQLAYILHNLANVYRSKGDLERALEYLERTNELMRIHMVPIQQVFHLTAIAHIRLQQGRPEDALRTYREAVDLSRRSRIAVSLAQSLRLLGEVLIGLGEHAEAETHLRESAGLFAQLEDEDSEAQILGEVAAVRERAGDWLDAGELWARVREQRRALTDRPGELDALDGMARAARRIPGAAGRAIQLYEEALGLARALNDRSREMAIRNALGILEWEAGRYTDALGHYESALRLCREIGDHAHEGLMLNSLGVTLSRLQRYEEARTVLEESVILNRATGERLLEAHAQAGLGDLAIQLGRPREARSCFERALELRRDLGDRAGELAMLGRLNVLS